VNIIMFLWILKKIDYYSFSLFFIFLNRLLFVLISCSYFHSKNRHHYSCSSNHHLISISANSLSIIGWAWYNWYKNQEHWQKWKYLGPFAFDVSELWLLPYPKMESRLPFLENKYNVLSYPCFMPVTLIFIAH
jgi:hypothetical protein